MPLKEHEILTFIQEDKMSPKKQRARTGLNYYEGQHDIKNYKLYYYDSTDQLVEDKTRSNIKISHPFFTEIVDQAVQYMLSGKERYIKSNTPELQSELDKYFDDEFNAELEETLTGCISKGFDYMYAYKNKDGRLAFQNADAMGVIEVEGKFTNTGKDYVIFWYVERIDKNKKQVKRIQVWDNEKTWYYTQIEDGKIKLDKGEGVINPKPHVIYHKANDDNTYYEGLGFIPFFRIDNNRKQVSGLQPIKSLIDDYDLMACGLSNNIQDASEYVVVVKGLQGEDVSQLMQNVRTKKHIGVSEGGDLDYKTVAIPYEARKVKLELDEKNIYRFGMAFNSAQLGDGNITNIVIKSRYALLDLKCNKLEKKLRQFLRKIIQVVLDEINAENDADYQQKDVYFDFEREVMTNAQDNALIDKTQAEIEQIRSNTIKMLETSIGSDEALKLICDVLDIDYEKIKDKAPARDDLEEFLNVANEPVNE